MVPYQRLLRERCESFGADRCGPDLTYATAVKGKKTRQRYRRQQDQQQPGASAKPSRRRAFSARGQGTAPIAPTLARKPRVHRVVPRAPSLVDPAYRLSTILDRRSSISDCRTTRAAFPTIELVARDRRDCSLSSQRSVFRQRSAGRRGDKRSLLLCKLNVTGETSGRIANRAIVQSRVGYELVCVANHAVAPSRTDVYFGENLFRQRLNRQLIARRLIRTVSSARCKIISLRPFNFSLDYFDHGRDR